MTILLLDVECQLDEADARADLLVDRLSFVGEWQDRVLREPHGDQDRAQRLAFLDRERKRLISEIRIVLAAACKLEALRDQALAGELD